MHEGRQTALVLLFAIIAARLLLNGRMQTAWYYLWNGNAPLGSESLILRVNQLGGGTSTQAQTQTAPASSGGNSGIMTL